jgi:hypothetical protein
VNKGGKDPCVVIVINMYVNSGIPAIPAITPIVMSFNKIV